MSKRKKLLNGSAYKNKSKIFLLPMLDLMIMHSSKEYIYLIDVNIIQRGFPQLVIIFENVDYEPLKEDIYRMSNSPYYVDSEYADDDMEICLFFDIPREFRGDFQKFKLGEYSKFSQIFKDKLTKTYTNARSAGINESNGLPAVSLYDVIYPKLETRELLKQQLDTDVHIDLIQELLDPPELNREEYKNIEEYGD